MKEHVVQFYDSDDFLIDAVARFITSGLIAGNPALMIVTSAHHAQLAKSLEQLGSGAGARPLMREQWAVLDAEAALEAVMVNGWPDEQRFMDVVGGAVRQTSGAGHGCLNAFGEMGTILWRQGKTAAAVRLEAMWNTLIRTHSLSVLCAYPISAFSNTADGHQFDRLCSAHLPASMTTAFAAASNSGQLLRHITMLQQQARSLEREMEKRTQIERELRDQLQELEVKERHKDEFMAMLGHELRNPLAPIAISLKLLRLQQGDGASSTQWLDIIERQSLLMKRLVDDLLDVSRIQLGKMELRKQVVQVDAIIHGAVELASPLFDTLQQQLTVTMPNQPITLYGDPDRLEQALANLLHNAAKYTGTAGRICLHAYQDQQDLVLSVSDNGSGLSPEARQKVFDLFQQGEQSFCHARGGLGVGLALVRQIADLHGGSISAFSDGPNCGSEFVLRLPRNLTLN